MADENFLPKMAFRDEFEGFDAVMDPSEEFVQPSVELSDQILAQSQQVQVNPRRQPHVIQQAPPNVSTAGSSFATTVMGSSPARYIIRTVTPVTLVQTTGAVLPTQTVSVVTPRLQRQSVSSPTSVVVRKSSASETVAPISTATVPAKRMAILIRHPPSHAKEKASPPKTGKKASTRVAATKKKKDPNAPAPPLTAYRAFFKETGQTVKTHNPAAKFGDVSRIVAGMWESMADSEKTVYRRKSEEDKARYSRELDEYNNARNGDSVQEGEDKEEEEEQEQKDDQTSVVFTSTTTTPSVVNVTTAGRINPEDVTDNPCIRKDCSNNAIRNSEWEDEYCSNKCVVKHCANVFQDWIISNTTAEAEVA